MEKNDIIENTGHDAKGAKGFDYQFLYFINRLLKMADKRDGKYSVNAVLCA